MRLRLVLVGIALLASTACGGAASRGDPLADANGKMAARGTVRAEVDARYDGGSEHCAAALDFDRQRARITCDSQGKLPGDDSIIVGKAVYTPVGDGKWTKLDDASDDLGDVDPRAILAATQKDAEEVSELGAEQVRGVDTTHYRFLVHGGAAELEPAKGATTAPLDVWIDGDGLVRRMRAVDAAGTDHEGTFEIEFFDFGADLDIEPPPADQIVDADEVGSGVAVAVGSDTLCSGPVPGPIDFEAFMHAIFESDWAQDAVPAAGPYGCDEMGPMITMTLGSVAACSHYAMSAAGPAVDRDGDALALQNMRCTITKDGKGTAARVEALLEAAAKR
jgi:hypothetical protein